MQGQRAWLKPGVWGAVIGSILTMIVGFSWGGWTTSSTALQVTMKQADAASGGRGLRICTPQDRCCEVAQRISAHSRWVYQDNEMV